ncbi:GDSL esterase/lipase [Citrus sinensis]|uniref:GDSL esterase/lipase n=1 Tax=Citrus sinensis TaxID=2711 RepID=A0ACB8IYE2_CITSI|nr:GDSL esterase/lipase [Citrus sinensis]
MAVVQQLIVIVLEIWTIIFNFSASTAAAAQPKKYSAVLVFGDSTADTGNNNFVNTLFTANHLPYGQDLPGHAPTGRFSNGKLMPDFIAGFLGIKDTIPPYLDPNLSNEDLLTGVCFASAGSGYDELTTAASGVIPVSKQLEYFKEYIGKINGLIGADAAKKLLSEAVVIISAGTNDMTFNYYDIPTRRAQFNISEYQDFLQTKLHNYIKQLYDLGCRQMIVAGLPPIGCLPIQITARFKNPLDRKCLDEQNTDSQSYNQKLIKLLNQLQASLPGTRLNYADVYEPVIEMVNNPQKYGFTVVNRGCCGTGFVEVSILCNPTTPKCASDSQFLFWDCIHPSEAAYQIAAKSVESKISP